MKPETFVRAANLSELQGAGPFALSANGVDVVVARAGGGWRAFAGRCPHQGALLGEGEIDGGVLVCRNHSWRFALDSGLREGGPECLASCPVAERNNALFIDIAGLEPSDCGDRCDALFGRLAGPQPLPLIGNLHQLDASKLISFLRDGRLRYGSIYQFWMGRRRIVATSDPALLEERSAAASPKPFAAPRTWTASSANSGIQGVFNAEGEVWRSRRQARRLRPRSTQCARALSQHPDGRRAD